MSIKYTEAYREKKTAESLLKKIVATATKPIRLMEVCGTHTVSIFRSGIRSILPDMISLISGPGCPVCVTSQKEIDTFIALAQMKDVIIATFGDLVRVPGTRSSLRKEKATGRDIRVVYSTMDALSIAKENPGKQVVFLGVGFETTTPTIAASIQTANETGIKNYSVCSAHKLVPPALEALMKDHQLEIDGFLLPGHVSVILGAEAYRPLFSIYRVPCVIAGFEPVDILHCIWLLAQMIESGTPELINGYKRVVTSSGNRKALKIIEKVFEPADSEWRGLGIIPASGLSIRKEFEPFDALKKFNISMQSTEAPKGCVCGLILTGRKSPPECTLYKTVCTPADPVGPCMVSSEGTCAAYYKYHTWDKRWKS